MRTGGEYQFKSADELMLAAQKYFDWCDTHPIRATRTVRNAGGEMETRDEQLPRCYTFEGLCDHINICDWWNFVAANKERKGFEYVIARIRNKIRRNQIEGGMAGVYKENLTARLNGIADNLQQVAPPPSTIEVIFDE